MGYFDLSQIKARASTRVMADTRCIDAEKMRCPNGHVCPTLQHVFRTLKLRDSDVLNTGAICGVRVTSTATGLWR